jgi:hypothetical protein
VRVVALLATCLTCPKYRLASVQYEDADEWYTVKGGAAELAGVTDLPAVRSLAVTRLDWLAG